MDEAWSMLSKLLAAQELERKEMKEQMAEEAHHLQTLPSRLPKTSWRFKGI